MHEATVIIGMQPSVGTAHDGCLGGHMTAQPVQASAEQLLADGEISCWDGTAMEGATLPFHTVPAMQAGTALSTPPNQQTRDVQVVSHGLCLCCMSLIVIRAFRGRRCLAPSIVVPTMQVKK